MIYPAGISQLSIEFFYCPLLFASVFLSTKKVVKLLRNTFPDDHRYLFPPAALSVFISWAYFVCFYKKSVKGVKPSRTTEKNSAYLEMVGVREFKIVSCLKTKSILFKL